jgi:serine/threonine-protein kinase
VTLYVALPPANIPIPPVTGLTLVAAEASVHAAGFRWSIKWQAPTAPGEAQNEVVDEVPGPPAGAPAGTVVTLDVIKGNYTIAVPPVAGMTQAQADKAINTAGLIVGTTTTEYSNLVASGLVISSNPPSGRKVAANSAVSLVVSSGSLTGIPYVEGESLQQAQTDISNAGLTYVIIPMAVSSPSEVGLIVKEHPGGGQLVKPGFQVTLYVAVSNPTTTTTTTSTTTTTTTLPPST